MAVGYTKDFLVEAFVSRYAGLGTDIEQRQRKMAERYYDQVGKDQFRTAASLDAEAIKKYKLELVSRK
jgi:hypothetical protein